jgi:organic hydroperoxide reductase OsmC/OhrA
MEVRTPGAPAVDVSSPPEFQGEAGMWTPETLFVASVNACFVLTFLAIARLSKLDVVSMRASAQGKLEKSDGGGYRITEIVIKPALIVRSEAERERAERLLEKAERNCFISNSITASVRLEPEIAVSA